MSLLAALLLLGCAPVQDPEPKLEPPSTELDALLAEVNRLADVVREGFRKVDTGLRGARDQADTDAADPSGLVESLGQTAADADQLLADMEELLAAIPEIKGDSKGGGKGQPDQKPEDAQNLDGSDEKPQPEDAEGGPDEDQKGQAAPANSYLRLLFDQDAGAWGMLPPRLQEALQNAVMEDLPLRYRRWLDEFHRN
ncbi:MAG: hypothetical protein ISR76_09690 [Planctomycetes bacterium]|nr:hypothetical protein [Planctomycetota bacterium]MBL7009258.1 hypothetical protein [Planctomycetota bacterium]